MRDEEGFKLFGMLPVIVSPLTPTVEFELRGANTIRYHGELDGVPVFTEARGDGGSVG